MTKKTNMIAGVAALALVFGAGPAFAQYSRAQAPEERHPDSTSDQGSSQTDRESAQKSSANTKAAGDENFAKKAAEGGMAEMKFGQLAQEKGSHPAVKDFGRRMVRDHSKANEELKSAASTQSIALPNEPDKQDQATYDRLSKLSGEAFDRAYARDMVKDHSKDVSEFQKEAKNGQDQAIKNFAAQTLPTLQSHLDQARQMEQAVNQSSSSAPGDENRPANRNTYPTNNTTPAPSSPSR